MPQKRNIVSVLLIPATGDPQQLLRDGACGSRPPIRFEGPEISGRARWISWSELASYRTLHRNGAKWIPDFDWDCPRKALVLAWNGEVVPEGTDRAARRAGASSSAVFGVIPCVLDGEAAPLALAGLGTLLCLDAEGREVTP